MKTFIFYLVGILASLLLGLLASAGVVYLYMLAYVNGWIL